VGIRNCTKPFLGIKKSNIYLIVICNCHSQKIKYPGDTYNHGFQKIEKVKYLLHIAKYPCAHRPFKTLLTKELP
jgi:hypothetical protein